MLGDTWGALLALRSLRLRLQRREGEGPPEVAVERRAPDRDDGGGDGGEVGRLSQILEADGEGEGAGGARGDDVAGSGSRAGGTGGSGDESLASAPLLLVRAPLIGFAARDAAGMSMAHLRLLAAATAASCGCLGCLRHAVLTGRRRALRPACDG